jgi:hypothetical protein
MSKNKILWRKEGKVLKFQEYSICQNENFKTNWLFDKHVSKLLRYKWFLIWTLSNKSGVNPMDFNVFNITSSFNELFW